MDVVPSNQCRTDSAALRDVTDAAATALTARPRRNAAIQYLRQRGIDMAGLSSEWTIGSAPPGWTRLVDELAGQFAEQVLLDAGLARRSSRGGLIDTFRDRVIFGIYGLDGISRRFHRA